MQKVKIIHSVSEIIKSFFLIKKPIFISVIIGLAAFISGCEKFEIQKKKVQSGVNQAKTNYFIHMTDAPGYFSEVNVDILSVVAKTNRGEVTLNVNAGIYNLLDFQNGVDTMIATGALDSCTVSQIRLILGNRNTVVVDSMSYPLKVPSGSTSGLKLQVHHELKAGVAYHVLLDFDANKSVVKTGNNQYILKPVIRTIDTAISGSIKGMVLPLGYTDSVTVSSNGTTYNTQVDANGYFMFQGLAPGTYDLTVYARTPYTNITLNGITVIKGKNTNLGLLNL